MKYYLYLLAFLFVPFSCTAFDRAPNVEQAQTLFNQGLYAPTLFERKQAFNQALRIYLDIEHNQTPHSDKLFGAIADTYYQLEEYAWSILYYCRALAQNPSNFLWQQRLNLAQEKLGLPLQTKQGLIHQLFSFYHRFFPSMRFIFFNTLLLFLSGSLTIWLVSLFWRKMTLILLSIEIFLLFNLIFSFYFTSIEGVLILPTGLYQGPHLSTPQLTPIPLVKGIKVQVTDSQKEGGSWLKIVDPEGTIGYVPATVIRLIP